MGGGGGGNRGGGGGNSGGGPDIGNIIGKLILASFIYPKH